MTYGLRRAAAFRQPEHGGLASDAGDHRCRSSGHSGRQPLENPIKSGLGGADKYGRRWKFVAGTLSPNALAFATVPDDPGCDWEGGSFERIEAQNRAVLKSHFATLRAAEEAENRGYWLLQRNPIGGKL